MDNRISPRPQPKRSTQQPKATGDTSKRTASSNRAHQSKRAPLPVQNKITPQNRPLSKRNSIQTQNSRPTERKVNKPLEKKPFSMALLDSLMLSQNERDFDQSFEAMEWVFPSQEEAESAFFYITIYLFSSNKRRSNNAQRLLNTFDQKQMHSFFCKKPQPSTQPTEHCEGAVIVGALHAYLSSSDHNKQDHHLKAVLDFIDHLLQRNPHALLQKNAFDQGAQLFQLLFLKNSSSTPPSQSNKSIGHVLNPNLELISKFILWGNWYQLDFNIDNVLFSDLNDGVGDVYMTQKWMRDFFTLWHALSFEANPAYQTLWQKADTYIKAMIESFEDNSFCPQNIANLANRIQNNKATAIGISMDGHLVSASVIGDFFLINNYGSHLNLKTCRLGDNPSPGTLIFKLKENTSLNQVWTPAQVEGLRNQLRNPKGFESAMDNIFKNYDVIGAYDARGQNRGNCAAKHNFLHIFNGLMVAAYELKDQEGAIRKAFQETLNKETDTHRGRNFPNAQGVNIRGQSVLFCNDDVLVQMASRMYRDMTLFMRTEAFLDVANDDAGMITLANALNPNNPKIVIEEFQNNLQKTFQNLLQLYGKRLIGKSAANHQKGLDQIGFNTFHKKNNPDFNFMDYIGKNLNRDSEFYRRLFSQS